MLYLLTLSYFSPDMERKGVYLKEETVVVTGQLLRVYVSDRIPRTRSAEVVQFVCPSVLDNQQQPESLNRRTWTERPFINMFIFNLVD